MQREVSDMITRQVFLEGEVSQLREAAKREGATLGLRDLLQERIRELAAINSWLDQIHQEMIRRGG